MKNAIPKVNETTPGAGAADSYQLRWAALALLALVQFVVVLDASVVNIALPSIGAGLGMSSAGLSWVVNAYVLAFGGLLLLGGRVADLFGRRAVFAGGLRVFGAASLARRTPGIDVPSDPWARPFQERRGNWEKSGLRFSL